MTRRQFLGIGALAVASLFGFGGIVRQFTSQAASGTIAAEPEAPRPAAPVIVVNDSSASGGSAVRFAGNPTPEPAAIFQLGTTKPILTDPDKPTAQDTVGAAYGWNGVTLIVMNGDQTIPAHTTWENRLIHGFVTFTDQSSRLVNSVVDGRAPGGNFQSGLVNGSAGGQLERVTLRASVAAATYYRNGLTSNGGDWILTRCDISRVVDGVHASNSGRVKLLGCRVHDFAFFANDADHANDSTRPYWTHNDALQRLSGSGDGDWVEGCSFEGFFDTTDVTWSGGVWGSGIARGGLIGMPSTALNAGYYNAYGKGNWSNVISYSNRAPYTGMTFLHNWFDGGNHPSGIVQMTVPGSHVFRLEGNRWGLGGKPSSANKLFLATYAASSIVDTGPTGSNVYDTGADTPGSLHGKPLQFTAGGASVTLP